MDIRDKLREYLGRAFIDEAKVQALVCYAQYTEDRLYYNCDVTRGETIMRVYGYVTSVGICITIIDGNVLPIPIKVESGGVQA